MPQDGATIQNTPAPALPPGRLHAHTWARFLRGPDPELLDKLYVPALAEAIRYDRCCAYFSSSALAAAARGFGRLIQRLLACPNPPKPAVRLIVNEEMSPADVRALVETQDTSKLEELLTLRLQDPVEALERDRLAMLGWLVKQGLLAVRVGVMRHGIGILHAKFGIVWDEAGDSLVFGGSGNESGYGLVANYERLEVSTSWDDPARQQEYEAEFEALWADRHPDVHTVSLPEAVRQRLIRFVQEERLPAGEPSNALARQKAAMLWRFIVEAPYLADGGTSCDATAMVDQWPHQRRVIEEATSAWPSGRLLCDEVGLGKTIEAVLILRRLMAGRGVKRALILLPAGLLKQWQSEFREKGGMLFPRLEGNGTVLVWPDETTQKVEGLAEALKQDVLLMSRETARLENHLPTLLAADPWDLVLLDEAHAARRQKQEEGEYNSGTLLLNLLRELQLRRKARGFLLLSATPMQTHPWEPWDLLAVLGEGGAWLAEFEHVRRFYNTVTGVQQGTLQVQEARDTAWLIAADQDFTPAPAPVCLGDADSVANALAFVPPSQRQAYVTWLRKASPLARRMHRNTRENLRRYWKMGLLAEEPPRRSVTDIHFDYKDPAERAVYNAVGSYIEKRYDELEHEKPGKGFVMTIYRRRASSSPGALECSLKRRKDGLLRVIGRRTFDPDLSQDDVPEALSDDDLPDDITGRISPSLPEDPGQARVELGDVERILNALISLHGKDSKRDEFFGRLRELREDGRAVLVFTEYIDTLEYLRELLVNHFGSSLACYSGDGGQMWQGGKWQAVTKDKITQDLKTGALEVLLCTDAASEGLNLQTASAVINYDLPWNPSKVEQRIGRIDRIGQKRLVVRVVNLFLKDSVDDRVYQLLRARCGLFEEFVGPMQPVLARARRMLMGQEPIDEKALDGAAAEARQNNLASESYLESEAVASQPAKPAIKREDVVVALASLDGSFGVRAVIDQDAQTAELRSATAPVVTYCSSVSALERDRSARPLSPFDPAFRELATSLWRAGERLPLVIGVYQKGAFRRAVVYWGGAGGRVLVSSAGDLREHLNTWDGQCLEPKEWQAAQEAADLDARVQVTQMEQQAAEREKHGLAQQVKAAQLRLHKELGRYLACFGAGTGDLNQVLYQQMTRDIASSKRLKLCLDRLAARLGDYPEWPVHLCRELDEFLAGLSENRRKARLMGTVLDAALQDPRWMARASP